MAPEQVAGELLKLWQAVSYLQGQMYVVMGLSLASFAGTCIVFLQNRRNGKNSNKKGP